jgi:hypothetical protein
MKKIAVVLMLLLSVSVVPSFAGDSVALGVRAGALTNHSSYITEVFGDLYLNQLVSVGGTLAYQIIDRDNARSLKRDESVPVTILAKVHVPLPLLSPYAGLGQTLVFHDKKSTNGSPVMLAGLDFKPLPMPLFINLEYRHQFNDVLNVVAGGVGVKF